MINILNLKFFPRGFTGDTQISQGEFISNNQLLESQTNFAIKKSGVVQTFLFHLKRINEGSSYEVSKARIQLQFLSAV